MHRRGVEIILSRRPPEEVDGEFPGATMEFRLPPTVTVKRWFRLTPWLRNNSDTQRNMTIDELLQFGATEQHLPPNARPDFATVVREDTRTFADAGTFDVHHIPASWFDLPEWIVPPTNLTALVSQHLKELQSNDGVTLQQVVFAATGRICSSQVYSRCLLDAMKKDVQRFHGTMDVQKDQGVEISPCDAQWYAGKRVRPEAEDLQMFALNNPTSRAYRTWFFENVILSHDLPEESVSQTVHLGKVDPSWISRRYRVTMQLPYKS